MHSFIAAKTYLVRPFGQGGRQFVLLRGFGDALVQGTLDVGKLAFQPGIERLTKHAAGAIEVPRKTLHALLEAPCDIVGRVGRCASVGRRRGNSIGGLSDLPHPRCRRVVVGRVKNRENPPVALGPTGFAFISDSYTFSYHDFRDLLWSFAKCATEALENSLRIVKFF